MTKNKIFIGIDEAGLGPTLGPLCYGWTGLVESDGEDVSKRLNGLIDEHNLSIGDSKKIFQGTNKKKKLFQAFYEVLTLSKKTADYNKLEDLWNCFPLNDLGEISNYSYYQECVSNVFANDQMISANDQINSFCGITSCFEGEMNHEFDKGLNKSVVSMMKIGEIITFVLNCYPNENVEIQVDKQGGRNFYSDFLNELFPFVGVEILSESSDESIYNVSEGQREITFGFYKKGEDRFPLIACGSILAKWLREQFMASFNSYWLAYNDVKATAGYPEDAKRFIDEMSPYFEKDSLPINLIIRNR